MWPGSEAALDQAGHGPPVAADWRGAVPLGDSELRMDPGLRSRGGRMRVEGDMRWGVGAAWPGPWGLPWAQTQPALGFLSTQPSKAHGRAQLGATGFSDGSPTFEGHSWRRGSREVAEEGLSVNAGRRAECLERLECCLDSCVFVSTLSNPAVSVCQS